LLKSDLVKRVVNEKSSFILTALGRQMKKDIIENEIHLQKKKFFSYMKHVYDIGNKKAAQKKNTATQHAQNNKAAAG
jgi:hypothetical protein